MICARCSTLLPHDVSHVRDHAAACSGAGGAASVEMFLGQYHRLVVSITAMVQAGGAPGAVASAGATTITTTTGLAEMIAREIARRQARTGQGIPSE